MYSGYETETDKKGNVIKYGKWLEVFKDKSTGDSISIERKELVEVNGESVRFYSDSELRKMSKQERSGIAIKWRK